MATTTSRKPLTPGDQVTLVLPDHVVMAEVSASERLRFGCVLTSQKGNGILSEHALSDEGVTWLPGYHLADSPAVLACRAAQALDGGKKAKKEKG